MKEFQFRCPSCGQRIKGNPQHTRSILECPTCFRQLIVPSAPAHEDSKLIPTAKVYVEGTPLPEPVRNPAATGRLLRTSLMVVGLVILASVGYLIASSFIGSRIPLANPGFETPLVNDFSYNPPNASWTFAPKSGDNGAGITGNHSAFTAENPPAPEGQQVAFLQGDGAFFQQVSGFDPGKRYTIKFLAAQRARISPDKPIQTGQTWDVQVNGVVVGSFSPPQLATGYLEYSAHFLAPLGTCTITFVGTDSHGGDNTIFIDNIHITGP